MTTLTRKKTKAKQKPVPEVWRAFLGSIEFNFRDSPEILKRAMDDAKSHEKAVLTAVAGRDDCYLFGHHRCPVVYRKPTYNEYEAHQINVGRLELTQSGDEEDRAIRYLNLVSDYVRKMIVYPAPEVFQSWIETRKHDLVKCVKTGLDAVSQDVVEAEFLKFNAPPSPPRDQRTTAHSRSSR